MKIATVSNPIDNSIDVMRFPFNNVYIHNTIDVIVYSCCSTIILDNGTSFEEVFILYHNSKLKDCKYFGFIGIFFSREPKMLVDA